MEAKAEPLPHTAPPVAVEPPEAPAEEEEEEEEKLGTTPPPPAIEPVSVEADEALVRLEEAAVQADPARRGAAWLEVAEYRRDGLADPDGAMPCFEAVLDHAIPGDPSYIEAMEALEDLHAVHARWDALVALYDRRLADGVGSRRRSTCSRRRSCARPGVSRRPSSRRRRGPGRGTARWI